MQTDDIISMYFPLEVHYKTGACSCVAQHLKQIDNESRKPKFWSKHLFLVHHLKSSLLEEPFAKPEHLSHWRCEVGTNRTTNP